jgi:hypothetical protein
MSRIAISGSTGLVGNALARMLADQGHQLVRLVRDKLPRPTPSACETSDVLAVWNPAGNKIDPHALEGCDAIVNLAGEPISRRWTNSVKSRIVESRVDATRLLAGECSRLGIPVLVDASAIGIYGDRGEDLLDERSPCGGGFLADTCVAWEHASRQAREAGTRTVSCRFGMILSRRGGALSRMRPVFRAGLGGALGTGRQWMSWIHLTDAVSVIEHALACRELDGPLLATSPHPVRQADFAAGFAHSLNREARFRVPAWVLRMAMGDMADELLLASQRCQPRRLTETGFRWSFPDLEQALRDLAG